MGLGSIMRNYIFFVIFFIFTFINVLSTNAQNSTDDFSFFANSSAWKNTDFSKSIISASELMSGGPPKDGIPAIDNPIFQKVETIQDIGGQEPVIVFEHNKIARAYPIRILMWHEIVNDKIEDFPIAVTYCPLCNSAVVFDRQFDGQILDFGVSGLLRNSDLVMYDRQSQSWWQQFTGQGLVGQYAGENLKMLPSTIMAFADFKEKFPIAEVLVPNQSSQRDYGRNPYVGYDSAKTPFLFSGDLPKGIEPMERVIYIRDQKEAIAISLNLLKEKQVMSRNGYQISWEKGLNSALDHRQINQGRDVGKIKVEKQDSQANWRPALHDITFAFVVHSFDPNVEIEK